MSQAGMAGPIGGPPPPSQMLHNTGMSYAQVIGSVKRTMQQPNNANCVMMKTVSNNDNNNTHINKQTAYQQQSPKPTATAGDAQSPNPTGKKKRRNRRRKRNSQHRDDPGALSDDPHELRNARSSSNVSHASTEHLNKEVMDDTLHFEDEEEFPDLMSASASHHHQGGATKSPVISSYSDILKVQPTVSECSIIPYIYIEQSTLKLHIVHEIRLHTLFSSFLAKSSPQKLHSK